MGEFAIRPEDVSPTTGFGSKATMESDDDVAQATFHKKVALHELGHGLGLAHFDLNFSKRPSVMRNPLKPNDPSGYMSQIVTECDRRMARRAAQGPWPRP